MKLLAAAAVTFALTGSTAAPPPTLGGCPVFPASSVWNQPVDKLPVAANSSTLIRSIGVDAGVHADFGNGLYDGSRIGIPYVVVHGRKTPKSRVAFDYADESDKGPYPIPSGVPIEGAPAHANDGDRHALIVDRDSCKLYELYALRRQRLRLGGRVRRDLEPALERPAAGDVDVGRRCGAADPPWARALGRRRVDGAHRPCVALHGRSARGRRTSTRRATTQATRPIRRCRRWACACG